MRTKHLIREFTKQGLTRHQAIELIRKGRKFRLKNKKIFKTMELSVSFMLIAKSTKQLVKGFQSITEAMKGWVGGIGQLANSLNGNHL